MLRCILHKEDAAFVTCGKGLEILSIPSTTQQ